jgi:hypothetical protein
MRVKYKLINVGSIFGEYNLLPAIAYVCDEDDSYWFSVAFRFLAWEFLVMVEEN